MSMYGVVKGELYQEKYKKKKKDSVLSVNREINVHCAVGVQGKAWGSEILS